MVPLKSILKNRHVQVQVQGTSVPFNAITGTDTMMKNGVPSPINTRHQCITCMKEYETKCLEELRFEDYQLGRKGSSQAGMFAAQAQQSPGLFSSIAPAANTSNLFGQRNTMFGSSSPSGGLFQTLNQPPKTNFFTPTTSSTFGTSTFSFSNPASQSPGMFGRNPNPTSTTGTLGTNAAFSFSQPTQQQPALGLFGQKPLATPVSSPAATFSAFGLPQIQNSTLNKPLPMFGTPNATAFGTPNQAFGSPAAPTSLFGSTAQTQAKPFSFSGFGTTPQPFGTASNPTNSTFSFNNPTPGTGLKFTSPATSTFGTSTSSGFAPFGTNTFTLGAPATNTGFGTTPFSFNNPSALSTGFSFLNPGVQNQLSQMNPQQPTPPTGPVPFATTPYKDSPLFYNLITNRSLENMTKPTNPLAQRAIKEASRRRTSSNLTSGPSANIRNLTFPVSKNQIFNKKNSIFDGFEEEDKGSTIDILSPKSYVKKLSINSMHSSGRHSMPSLSNDTILKTTGSLITNLNESGRFDVDLYENDRVGRPYANESFGETLNSVLDESNVTLEDYSIGAGHSSGDFTNRFHVPSPESSFNEGIVYDGNSAAVIKSSTNGGPYSGVVSTRPGYFIQPTVAVLDNMTTDNGMCLVRGFVIGRHNFGQIRFLETVNVAGINLDEIFFFRHKEVNVYPDDETKPSIGQGINCAAEIKMERVWPIDKDSREPIKSPAKIRSLNYEDKLKRSCKRMDAEFISYDHETGIWIFRVHHFSKYSCVPEENEDDDTENLPPDQVPLTKGLGGITSQELKSGVLLSPPQPQTSQPPVIPDINASGEGTFLKPRSWTTRYQSTPIFHSRSNMPTPKGRPRNQIQMSDRELFLGTGDNEVDMDDVDFNPLTPSEYDSEDSDKDSVDKSTFAASKHSLYGSIIRDVVVSPKLTLMKSIMSRELNPVTEEDEGSVRGSPPPNKKSRLPRTSLSERKKIRFSDVGGVKRKDSTVSNLTISYRGRMSTDGITTSSLALKPVPTETEPPTNIPLRQFRKRDEVRRDVNVMCPPVSLFKCLEMCPTSLSTRRRGCRVSFGLGGHFTRVKSVPGKVSTQVEVMKLDSYAMKLDQRCSSFYKRAVEQQLDFQLKHQPDLSLTGDEFVVEAGGNISEQIQFLQLFLVQQHSDSSYKHLNLLNEELHVWSLCKILWPKDAPRFPQSDPVFLASQRQDLVKWFQINSQMLFGDLYDSNDKSVKGCLMRGMKMDACEQAVHDENMSLALCLAQNSIRGQRSCKYQVTQWQIEGADDFIPHTNTILYELSGGLPIWEKLDFRQMCTRQWLQHFAIYLWYIASPHLTVQEIVNRYQRLILEHAGTDSEDQAFPMKADSSLSNLCIQLLKVFAFTGYPMKIVLDSPTNNPDSLDYKLSWLLMLNLEQVGGLRIDTELRENITYGFAGQLERLGLFRWAVYVLKHLQPSFTREMLIRRILERNLKSCDDGYDEFFLVDCLRIKLREMFAAKALQASTEGRTYHEMWYLLKCNRYEDAYKIFERNIREIYFTEENIDSWNALFEEMYSVSLHIHDWEKHGLSVYSLFCAVNQILRSDVHYDIQLAGPEVRKCIEELFNGFTRISPKNSSEVLILLELCIAVKGLAQLLVKDTPLTISLNSVAHFPQFELLNTKPWGTYSGQVRNFFHDLQY